MYLRAVLEGEETWGKLSIVHEVILTCLFLLVIEPVYSVNFFRQMHAIYFSYTNRNCNGVHLKASKFLHGYQSCKLCSFL